MGLEIPPCQCISLGCSIKFAVAWREPCEKRSIAGALMLNLVPENRYED